MADQKAGSGRLHNGTPETGDEGRRPTRLKVGFLFLDNQERRAGKTTRRFARTNRQIEVIEWELTGRVEAVFVAPYLYVSKACWDSREEIVSWARSLLESGETEVILRKDRHQIQEGASPAKVTAL